MLKVMVIFMLLMGGWASAQNDVEQKDQSEEQTRRPSWSSGLPEREKTDTIGRPSLSPDFKDELTIDRSELGLERPKADFSLPAATDTVSESAEATESAESRAELIAEPVAQPSVEQSPPASEPVVVEPPVMEPEIAPASYQWKIISQADVDFPASGIRNQITGWVDVEVTLNPQGDVVNAEAIDNSNGAAIYKESAESTIRNWVFQAPQEQGVNELVSKVYRIDFVPPAIEQAIATQPEISVSDEVSSDESPASQVIQADYQWRILNQAPLDYPLTAARKRLEGWVDLLVTIDADGKVINLEEESYSSRGQIFVEPAKNSLEKWQFEPPSTYGISENLTRSYRVEFKL